MPKISVSAGLLPWSGGLYQITFDLLPLAGRAWVTRSLKIPLRPPLWVPDKLRRRIPEAVNPANEGIDVRRVGRAPVALPLLHDSQQYLW